MPYCRVLPAALSIGGFLFRDHLSPDTSHRRSARAVPLIRWPALHSLRLRPCRTGACLHSDALLPSIAIQLRRAMLVQVGFDAGVGEYASPAAPDSSRKKSRVLLIRKVDGIFISSSGEFAGGPADRRRWRPLKQGRRSVMAIGPLPTGSPLSAGAT